MSLQSGELAEKLEDARLRRFRVVKSRMFRRITGKITARCVLPIALLAILVLGPALYHVTDTDKTTFWWFAVALVVLAMSIVHGEVFTREAGYLHDDIKEDLNRLILRAQAELNDTLKKNIDTHAYPLQTRQKIRSIAAQVIQNEIEKKRIEDKKLRDDQTYKCTSTTVVYFGSASLTASEQEMSDARHFEAGEKSDIVRYQTALDDLRTCGMEVKRYIRFLDEGELKARSPAFRTNYLKWLRQQSHLVKSNIHYQLYIARRAPPWGASRNSILTTGEILDIVGEGDAGLWVVDPRIAVTMRQLTVQYFHNAARDNQPKRIWPEDLTLLTAQIDLVESVQNAPVDEGDAGRAGPL